MKKFTLVIMFFALAGCTSEKVDRDRIQQYSTLQALIEAVYDGETTLGELKKHGDLGLGTFNTLDGEMIMVDGKIYQFRADGKIYLTTDSMKTPFACTTFFEPDKTIRLKGVKTYKELKEKIDKLAGSENIPVAVKIKGHFEYVKTRSVPAQKKPYKPLPALIEHQPMFTYENVNGQIVGFRLPGFMKGINVAGFHLHFLNEIKSGGGHLLEVKISNAVAEIDYTPRFSLSLPEKGDFLHADISGDKSEDVEKVEK